MRKSISSNNAEIFYNIVGSGQPLLLLHGFAENGDIWRDLSGKLDKYLLIIPDLPGSGDSTSLMQERVSLSDFAKSILSILEHENIDSVHFIGHSMGGYIALEFASMFPDRLRSLGLFHSSAFADNAEKIQTRKKAIDFIENHGSSSFLKTSIPALFKDPELHKDAITRLIEQGGSFLPKSLVQYYEAMIERKDHALLLGALQMPVLFLIGEHDKAVPLNLSLKQCYLPVISFVHILRRSAHMGMFEEPDTITLMIDKFLQQVSRD